MRRAATKEDGSVAYNKVLFTVGNNHGGTLYPAAVAALPAVLEVAFNGQGWARKSAFLQLLKDPTGDEIVRINILGLLEAIDDDVAEVAAVLRSLPERSDQGSFDGARRKFLIEHGYL